MGNLAGKRILFLGSSVTYGHFAEGISFADIIAERTGMIAVKEAVSGTTLVDEFCQRAFENHGDGRSYIARMEALDKAQHFDAVVVQLSTNDATQGKTLGELGTSFDSADFDKLTITGAMEYIIAYAKETWNCPVFFYSGAYFEHPGYIAMADRMLEIADKWGIGVIDLFHDKDFNNIDKALYDEYMHDPVHPFYKGYAEWWAPYIQSHLEELI